MLGCGSHVTTVTFLAAKRTGGQGRGFALIRYCLAEAKASGFRAMQFSQVVATIWLILGSPL
jgi:hypothetical protein